MTLGALSLSTGVLEDSNTDFVDALMLTKCDVATLADISSV